MRAIVGDVVGKIRLLDVWNDATLSRFGGDAAGSPDPGWSCGAIVHFAPSSFCVLHSSGSASFLDTTSRASTLALADPAPALSLSFAQDRFTATFSRSVVTFTNSGRVNAFQTVAASCAASFADSAALGRLGERTLIYDVATGAPK
jgi:hypothetical protein